MRTGPGIAVFALAAGLGSATPLWAQSPGGAPDAAGRDVAPVIVEDAPAPQGARGPLPVMTLDQDALYRGSAWGLRVQADLERRGRQIAEENDRLAADFSREEQELTELRQTLPAEEFRKRADEFDQRVVTVRREREAALVELQSKAEEERTAFFRAMLPVLTKLMRERGAVAILDERAIFVAAESIDATDDLIARADAEIGAGPQQDPAPDAAAQDAPTADQNAPDQSAPDQNAPAPAAPSAPTPAPPAPAQGQ